jgi:hypothetical protein
VRAIDGAVLAMRGDGGLAGMSVTPLTDTLARSFYLVVREEGLSD